MKKPKIVIEAEAAVSAKAAEVTAAKETLKRLEAEHAAAYAAVRQAQTEADASLPQCRLVRVRRFGGNEEDCGRCVIVRRTPGGLLVVRSVGDADCGESKFKFSQHRGLYVQAEKTSRWSDPRQLRDVPVEYMPSAQAA
jgi:hypothetical protein